MSSAQSDGWVAAKNQIQKNATGIDTHLSLYNRDTGVRHTYTKNGFYAILQPCRWLF